MLCACTSICSVKYSEPILSLNWNCLSEFFVHLVVYLALTFTKIEKIRRVIGRAYAFVCVWVFVLNGNDAWNKQIFGWQRSVKPSPDTDYYESVTAVLGLVNENATFFISQIEKRHWFGSDAWKCLPKRQTPGSLCVWIFSVDWD